MSIVDQSPSFVMKEGLKSNTSSTPGSVPFPRTKRSLGSRTAKLSQILSLYIKRCALTTISSFISISSLLISVFLLSVQPLLVAPGIYM